uniref:Uncharacterized protein n=1 Tax=Romanomermis culicivorax TaxID=13658 RepID=A0A915L4L6_ROMCU
MASRSKRQKKEKAYALVDFDDGTWSIINTKKLEGSLIDKGQKVFVTWPNIGRISGAVWAISNSITRLSDAHTKGSSEYISDDKFIQEADGCDQLQRKSLSVAKKCPQNPNNVDPSNWVTAVPFSSTKR